MALGQKIGSLLKPGDCAIYLRSGRGQDCAFRIARGLGAEEAVTSPTYLNAPVPGKA